MRRQPDDGFTLIELLLVTAIVVVVIPSVTAVLLVYFRTSFVASTRTDRAHDANLLGAYLQPDLASLKPDPTARRASAVASGASCLNSLQLSWWQRNYIPNGSGNEDAYVATYQVAAATGADAPFALQRALTLNGTAVSTVVLQHNLNAACDAVFVVSGSAVTATITQSDSSGNAEPSVLHFSGSTGGRS